MPIPMQLSARMNFTGHIIYFIMPDFKDTPISHAPIEVQDLDPLMPAKDERWLNKFSRGPQNCARVLWVGPSGRGKTNTAISTILNNTHYTRVWIFSKTPGEGKYQFMKNLLTSAKDATNKNDISEIIRFVGAGKSGKRGAFAKSALEKKATESSFSSNKKLPDFILSSSLDDVPLVKDIDPGKKHQTIIIFDDMINEKASKQQKIKELFTYGRKSNLQLHYLGQRFYQIPAMIRDNATHFVFFRPNSRRRQKDLAQSLAMDIDVDEFHNLFETATNHTRFSFLFIDTYNRSVAYKYRCGFNTRYDKATHGFVKMKENEDPRVALANDDKSPALESTIIASVKPTRQTLKRKGGGELEDIPTAKRQCPTPVSKTLQRVDDAESNQYEYPKFSRQRYTFKPIKSTICGDPVFILGYIYLRCDDLKRGELIPFNIGGKRIQSFYATLTPAISKMLTANHIRKLTLSNPEKRTLRRLYKLSGLTQYTVNPVPPRLRRVMKNKSSPQLTPPTSSKPSNRSSHSVSSSSTMSKHGTGITLPNEIRPRLKAVTKAIGSGNDSTENVNEAFDLIATLHRSGEIDDDDAKVLYKYIRSMLKSFK